MEKVLMNNAQIVSYDAKKIWKENEDNVDIFCKYTDIEESSNNDYFTSKCIFHYIKVDEKSFAIKTPKIYGYDQVQKILRMEYCIGDNLELLLRSKETYKWAVKLLNSVLKFLISNKIFWIDFAPRNILVTDNYLVFVDFEKGFMNSDTQLYQYFRNHAYEEYSCFSFVDDRFIKPDYVYSLHQKERNDKIIISDIGPKRIKALAELIGLHDIMTTQDYLYILRLINTAESPYVKDDEFIFPRVELEKLLYDKNENPDAFFNYGKEILRRNKEAEKTLRKVKNL